MTIITILIIRRILARGTPQVILATFYPFSQFCEIDVSLPSLENQPKTAPNLFQRG